MKTASVAHVQAHFSEYVAASKSGPVVVTRNRKPVVVLLAVDDEEELERLLMAHSTELQAMLSEARERIAAGKGIPSEQFWKEVEKERSEEPPLQKRRSAGKRRQRDRKAEGAA